MKVSTCFAKKLELNDTGNLFFKNCLIKYGSFIDSLVPIGFYHISESRKHRSNSLSHQFAIPQKYYCVFSKPPYKSMVWFLYDRNLHHERVKESQGDKKKFGDSFSNIFTQGTRESILFYSLGSII